MIIGWLLLQSQRLNQTCPPSLLKFRFFLESKKIIKHLKSIKEEKMEKNKKKLENTFEEISCEDACQECNCFADSEDALLDLEKMTAEKKKEYLDELLRNRSFGR